MYKVVILTQNKLTKLFCFVICRQYLIVNSWEYKKRVYPKGIEIVKLKTGQISDMT